MKELTALVKTYLKANTRHSSGLSDEEKLFISPGSIVRAAEAEDASDYWHLVDATLDGVATGQRRLAFKKHWSAPSEAVNTNDPRIAAAALLNEGKSISDVSKALGVDRRRVKRWATSTKL